MRFAVATVSPPNFRHSRAFDEVAEGLHLILLALGYDSVLTNRLDLDDRRTIVLGGNLLVRNGLEPPKNPIFYNLEQLGDDLPSMTLPGFTTEASGSNGYRASTARAAMPGSHARRSSSTCTTGKRRSSKSHVFPICSPINGRWFPSVVPIGHWSAT